MGSVPFPQRDDRSVRRHPPMVVDRMRRVRRAPYLDVVRIAAIDVRLAGSSSNSDGPPHEWLRSRNERAAAVAMRA